MMAEKKTISLDKLKEAFECEICLDQLCDPRHLPCHHSYCKDCLDNCLKFQADGSAILRCPKNCVAETHIEETNTIDSLPRNYSMQSLLELLKSNADVVPPACEGMQKCENIVCFSCTGCTKRFCRQCFIADNCEDKKFIPIGFDERSQTFQAVCEEHKSLISHVCVSCDTALLCVYCFNRNHRGHKRKTLQEFSDDAMKWFSSKVENCEGSLRSKTCSEEIAMITNFENSLMSELKERKIKLLTKYITKLNKEETDILSTFQKESTPIVKKLQSNETPLQGLEKFLQSVQSKDKIEMVTQNQRLITEFNNLTSVNCLDLCLNESDGISLGSLSVDVFQASSSCEIVFLTKMKRIYENQATLDNDKQLLSGFLQDLLAANKESVSTVPNSTIAGKGAKPKILLDDHKPLVNARKEDNQNVDNALKSYYQLVDEDCLVEYNMFDQCLDTPATSKEEIIRYHRDFLLSFQSAPICRIKPSNLPDVDFVLSNPHPPTVPLAHRQIQQIRYMPSLRQASHKELQKRVDVTQSRQNFVPQRFEPQASRGKSNPKRVNYLKQKNQASHEKSTPKRVNYYEQNTRGYIEEDDDWYD